MNWIGKRVVVTGGAGFLGTFVVEKLKAKRWSPRAYQTEAVSDAQLRKIFEAGRGAHSCFNEQPWRILFATRDGGAQRDALEKILDEGNAYAKQAWVLGLTLAKKTFTLTGKPNRHGMHDVGSASQLMSLCAHDMGLGMRFMAGYDVEAARRLVPDDFEPCAMFVIGHPEKGLEKPPRNRRPLQDFVFEGAFGSVWKGLEAP